MTTTAPVPPGSICWEGLCNVCGGTVDTHLLQPGFTRLLTAFPMAVSIATGSMLEETCSSTFLATALSPLCLRCCPAPMAEVSYKGLAEVWEKDLPLRRRVLDQSSILQWLNPKLVGVVTMKMLQLNVPATMHLLRIYLPQAPKAKTCNLELVKEQARVWKPSVKWPLFLNCRSHTFPCQVCLLRTNLCLDTSATVVHCEGVALRGIVSLINRRNDGCKRQDPPSYLRMLFSQLPVGKVVICYGGPSGSFWGFKIEESARALLNFDRGCLCHIYI